jgi:hypothetical protein
VESTECRNKWRECPHPRGSPSVCAEQRKSRVEDGARDDGGWIPPPRETRAPRRRRRCRFRSLLGARVKEPWAGVGGAAIRRGGERAGEFRVRVSAHAEQNETTSRGESERVPEPPRTHRRGPRTRGSAHSRLVLAGHTVGAARYQRKAHRRRSRSPREPILQEPRTRARTHTHTHTPSPPRLLDSSSRASSREPQLVSAWL